MGMNVAYYASRPPGFRNTPRHLFVAQMTALVFAYTCALPIPHEAQATTTTTGPPDRRSGHTCVSEHSNVGAIMKTVAVVSGEAFLFSLLGKVPGFLYERYCSRSVVQEDGPRGYFQDV